MMPSREEFEKLVRDSNRDDPEALAALSRLLDANSAIWQTLGNLGHHAESALLTLVAGTDQLARQSIARKLHELRTELTGPSPTALERLAVDRLVICWLQVQHADVLFGGTATANAKQTTMAVRWLDQATRRYHLAVKSLLDIRRLLPTETIGRRPIAGQPAAQQSLRVFNGGDSEQREATGT